MASLDEEQREARAALHVALNRESDALDEALAHVGQPDWQTHEIAFSMESQRVHAALRRVYEAYRLDDPEAVQQRLGWLSAPVG